MVAHERLGIVGCVPDAHFEHPRLVAIYDALHSDRRDLDLYIAMADDLGARRVLDLGCGTGTLALLLVERGVEVVGVDPAAGSLRVAQTKAGADRVCWIHGGATALPSMQADLATMTANVAQAIVDPADWDRTLGGVHRALRPGGRLVFETRDPVNRAWERWTRAATHRSVEIAGVGAVESWTDLVEVNGPLVSFRQTWVFARDGDVLTSDSTLRFRERDEVVAALLHHGYVLEDVLDAPDRQIGREMVFVARRPWSAQVLPSDPAPLREKRERRPRRRTSGSV
jgi:SAM-dependent methyltransferase